MGSIRYRLPAAFAAAALFASCNLFTATPEPVTRDAGEMGTVMPDGGAQSSDANDERDTFSTSFDTGNDAEVLLDSGFGDATNVEPDTGVVVDMASRLDTGPTDTGATPEGHICNSDCDVTCNLASDSVCQTNCSMGSSCTWTCNAVGADCLFDCGGTTSCDGICNSGGCTMKCAGGADCTFACPGGGCRFSCSGQATCTTSCDGGGCQGP